MLLLDEFSAGIFDAAPRGDHRHVADPTMTRIILVDDHNIVREGLKSLLDAEPAFTVVAEAETGEEALDKVRAVDADVVVLDLVLPDRSGFDIVRQILTLRPKIAVLILSMHAQPEFAVRAFRAGASGYLTKKSAAGQLVNGIRKVASGGRFVTPELAEQLAFDLRRTDEGDPHTQLTEREFQVFLAIAVGKPVRDIARELNLSVKTVNNYRLTVLTKMGMKNNAELVRYAVIYHLIG
jgi:DNA-binding NarL/FixJ family response regulator